MDSLKALLHFETWPRKAGVKPYDPYNPAARDIYWAAMKKNIFDLGMDAWWLDSTEPDHMDIKDQDFNTQTYLGSFRRVHNAFPLMSNKGVYEHQRATTSDKRVFLLPRTATVCFPFMERRRNFRMVRHAQATSGRTELCVMRHPVLEYRPRWLLRMEI